MSEQVSSVDDTYYIYRTFPSAAEMQRYIYYVRRSAEEGVLPSGVVQSARALTSCGLEAIAEQLSSHHKMAADKARIQSHAHRTHANFEFSNVQEAGHR